MSGDPELFAELSGALERGEPRALAMVVEAKGSVPREPGACMVVAPDGRVWGTVGGGKLESLVIEAAHEALASGLGALRQFHLHEQHPESFGAICGGSVTVFIRPLPDVPRLAIVGAGHCAAALARAARMTHWRVEVWEDRAEFLVPERFAEGVTLRRAASMTEAMGTLALDAMTAVCLLNRSAPHDRDCLAALAVREEWKAASPPFYLGMIGSRRKVEMVRDELRNRGVAADFLERVRAPVGLPIGAETPEEIAISILAEIVRDWRLRRAARPAANA